MSTVMFFFAGMAVIIFAIFYVGYRVDRKNQWRREDNDPTAEQSDPLDPTKL
ncbi:MAG: hypothetical protein L3J47_08960 [Sulfurovum sp.]|nr:hypothetical protein [Sulfurovum sp.]